MKLTKTWYCPECDEVFERKTNTVCPSCTNRQTIMVSTMWKGANNVETIDNSNRFIFDYNRMYNTSNDQYTIRA